MSPPRPETTPDTSWNLLRSVQDGSPEAWQRIVHLYAPVVARWCRRSGLQADDADNVLQDVFLTLARTIGTFRRDRGSGRFRAWLSTITRMRIADHLRRQNRQPSTLGEGDAQRLPHGETDPEAEGEVDPDFRNLELRRALDLIQGAVQPATWEAFWQTVIDGRAAIEVAASLGLSVGAVGQAKFRILERLRHLLE